LIFLCIQLLVPSSSTPDTDMSSSQPNAFEGLLRPADEAFQRLLRRSSISAAERFDPVFRIRQFCRMTREFFQVDGTYFWRLSAPDELIGSEADGLMAQMFGGTRLRAADNAVLNEAIRRRKTVYANHLPTRFKLASRFQARALMATPLLV